ncbi:lipocalin family protein [Hymenobacter weizhouensis]|uniref:lipocalin family protein n=1 Tax=Hymenobacter sp. YIM 151500-1 TaxID=2987689 RepID=UPI0022264024|nr:lipocalin family protein [Hymenobacter sp. YIM 151500-1]UYZ61967.1 hypothetical protein OIS53_13255 [Hymenobacter sp. YIM 151500-1]
MKRVPFLVLAVAASSAFVGCGSDDKNDPTPTKTNSELLMAKSWMLTAETEATGTAAPVSTYNDYESYEKDNVYKFQANSVFVMEEGATREDPTDPASANGVWALSDGDKSLTYQVGFFGTGLLSSTQKGEIEELTATKLVVKMTDARSTPTIITRQTFTAQ